MPIPQYQEFMTPALQALKDSIPKTISEIENIVVPLLGITPEECNEYLPSGTQRTVRNRLTWALNYMYQAQLLERLKRGVYRISERGLNALATNRNIDNAYLSQYESFRKFVNLSHKKDNSEDSSAEVEQEDPSTRIEKAVLDYNEQTRHDLLEQLKKIEPTDFEKICLILIQAMGYGRGELTKISHDGGVDVIVNEDPLGLDKIYIQSKRFNENNRVNETVIRSFFGTLDTHHIKKGIIMTSGFFAPKAIEAVKNVDGKKVLLINGETMAQLMLDYNIGVRTVHTYKIKEIDEDFFADYE